MIGCLNIRRNGRVDTVTQDGAGLTPRVVSTTYRDSSWSTPVMLRGRVQQSVASSGGLSVQTQWSYPARHAVVTTGNDGQSVTSLFNAAGDLTSLTVPGSGGAHEHQFSVDPSTRSATEVAPATADLPDASQRRSVAHWGTDRQVSGVEVPGGAGVSMAYDDATGLLQHAVTTDADGVTGGSTDFTYNLSSTAAIAGNGQLDTVSYRGARLRSVYSGPMRTAEVLELSDDGGASWVEEGRVVVGVDNDLRVSSVGVGTGATLETVAVGYDAKT